MYFIFDFVKEMVSNDSFFESASLQYSQSERGYELIEHAYELMEKKDKMYYADAITNLRKAVNYRVSLLFDNLGIEKLNFDGLGETKKLEKLEALGIVKPLLINKLLFIRNEIEYRDMLPPDKNECEELIDIVWYFYKSTDRYCNVQPDEYLIDFDGEDKFLLLKFDFKNHDILKIRGNLPNCYFSPKKQKGSLLLNTYSTNIDLNSDYKLRIYKVKFCGEILVKNIKEYFDMFSIALREWGN